MKLRVWVLATTLVLVIAFGIALPSLLSDKTTRVAISYEAVKADFQDEFISSFAALYHTSSEDPLNPQAQDNSQASDNPQAPVGPQAPDNPTTNQTPPTDTPIEIPETQTPLGGTEVYVKDGWINEKINAHRASIDDEDLAKGSEIYNRLDTDFIFGLADGGLTEEERGIVDTYLKSQLSGNDYELARVLYNKYIGLLNYD